MRVRWLKRALENLEAEFVYIAQENPAAATRMMEAIEQTVALLAENPALGRSGRVPGTRELVIVNFPYILPYRVKGKTLQLLRVLHTSRQAPAKW